MLPPCTPVLPPCYLVQSSARPVKSCLACITGMDAVYGSQKKLSTCSFTHLHAYCTCGRLLLISAGAATPLRDSAWSGGRTPMHPSMEDRAEGFDGYGPTSQRGATPSYAGGGYAGTPFNPSSDDGRHVSFGTCAVPCTCLPCCLVCSSAV